MLRSTRTAPRTGRLAGTSLGLALLLTGCGQASGPAPSTGDQTDTATATSTASEPASTTDATDEQVEPPCDAPAGTVPQVLTVVEGEADGPAVQKAQQLLDLAAACDTEGLAELATAERTMLSLGALPADVAFAGAEGEERVHAMAVVLSRLVPDVQEDGEGATYVQWPGSADGLDETAATLVRHGLYSEDEVASMGDFGAYTGWRVVVAGDGTWTFMGAGE